MSAWEAQYHRAAQTADARSAGAVLMSIATSQVDLPASPDALTFATSFTFIDPSGSTYAIRFDDITTTQIASIHTGSRFPPPSPDDLVLFQSLPETVGVGPLEAITVTWDAAMTTAATENLPVDDVGTMLFVGEGWREKAGTATFWQVTYTNVSTQGEYIALNFWVDGQTGAIITKHIRRVTSDAGD
jgi:hypothetical protein